MVLFKIYTFSFFSAPTLAFVLKGENVIKGIYELAGPMNPEEAREKFPMS